MTFPLNDGRNVVCPGCCETYWSEDGHPDGTLCPLYTDLRLDREISYPVYPDICECRQFDLEDQDQ